MKTPLSSRILSLAALVAMGLAVQCAQAQGTHLWSQSRLEDFEKGTPQGVMLTSDGHLLAGPGLAELNVTPASFVWSVAADKNGTAYMATATPAAVLRASTVKGAKAETLFESKQVAVEVLRMGPDGMLYAATLPDGKIYRIDPAAKNKLDESSATLVFDAAKLLEPSKEKTEKPVHYIWDLKFDAEGRLYIALGGPAAVYRIDLKNPHAVPERFFSCDEQHIRSLAWDAKGNLIAGTDGSGLVYSINPQGKGYVLFESPRREITSVAVSEDGTIYAATVGDKSHNPLPQLTVQTGSSMSYSVVSPGSQQVANASASIPEGSEIYALREGEAARKLWADKDDIVYALSAEKSGVLVLTGNRGRIFRLGPDGSFADLAHLDAQQALSITAAQDAEGGLLVGTGNTGKLYRLGAKSTPHQYASDVLDAGALARFGRIEVEPGSKGYRILTRTGNVEQPARTHTEWGWSEWVPLQNGRVASPAGRYFEWKVELDPEASLGSIGVNYLPVNAAPVVDDLVVAPGARWFPQGPSSTLPTVNINFASAAQASSSDSGSSSPLQANKDRTAVTVRWAAHDENGDELSFALYLRGDGEKSWRLLKDRITEHAYSFDAEQIPDGGYRIKVVASDAPSHNPGEAMHSEKISDRFELDTTAPVVRNLKAVLAADGKHLHVSFDASDATSVIAHAEFSLDAADWQTIEPIGGLSDARDESYSFDLPLDSSKENNAEHLIVVRVSDRHENSGLSKTLFAAQ